MDANGARALSSLSVEEVAVLLYAVELGSHVPQFVSQGISGADLAIVTEQDLLELGIGLGMHRRRLLVQLSEFDSSGVPAHLLMPPGEGNGVHGGFGANGAHGGFGPNGANGGFGANGGLGAGTAAPDPFANGGLSLVAAAPDPFANGGLGGVAAAPDPFANGGLGAVAAAPAPPLTGAGSSAPEAAPRAAGPDADDDFDMSGLVDSIIGI